MSPLERLYRLEIEFHRQLRTSAADEAHAAGLHTSYALQCGYEQRISDAGTVAAPEIDSLRQRLAMAGDTRDVLAASDSLKRLLGIRLMGS
jgi:hypothetical protein